MELSTTLSSIQQAVVSNANVKAVYGEPITAEGKTIVPVARIAYGFGGGSGSREGREGAGESGGGGGGGAMAVPVGVVEITAGETRFIPAVSPGKLAAAAGAGMLVGMLLGRRRSRR